MSNPDRRISVAPMMDCTDSQGFDLLSNYLRVPIWPCTSATARHIEIDCCLVRDGVSIPVPMEIAHRIRGRVAGGLPY